MAQNNSRENGRLYFAYGSNLSTTQMRYRCPYSTLIGMAHLRGWTWIINKRGYANIVQDGNKASRDTEDQAKMNEGHGSSDAQPQETVSGPGVYGLVYRLHPDDEETLDRCEGVGYAYERKMLDIAWAHVSDPDASRGSSSVAAGVQPAAETKEQSHEETTSLIPGEKFEALVYIDFQRIMPSNPKAEYVGRMNIGIKEASEQWGLPLAYVDEVMRPYIPAANDANRVAATSE